MRAIRQHTFGGPEVLQLEDVPDPVPGPAQVRIAVEICGVHLVDCYIRAGQQSGAYPPPTLPMTPGREVAGVVDTCAGDVDPAWLGRRVAAHLGPASGGYAAMAVADVGSLIVLPDQLDAAVAVAMLGTGRTTLAILETEPLAAHDIALITAAAGGIGSLLIQAARAAGAFVVGAAGGEEKAALVKARGADVAVDYSQPGWDDALREQLGDDLPTLAYDGVGGDIGRQAMRLVRPGGRMAVYGYSSGTPMPLSIDALMATGVTVSAAIGVKLLGRPQHIHELAVEAIDRAARGELSPAVDPPFPLAEAADAHRALESRRTTGKVVLAP